MCLNFRLSIGSGWLSCAKNDSKVLILFEMTVFWAEVNHLDLIWSQVFDLSKSANSIRGIIAVAADSTWTSTTRTASAAAPSSWTWTTITIAFPKPPLVLPIRPLTRLQRPFCVFNGLNHRLGGKQRKSWKPQSNSSFVLEYKSKRIVNGLKGRRRVPKALSENVSEEADGKVTRLGTFVRHLTVPGMNVCKQTQQLGLVVFSWRNNDKDT